MAEGIELANLYVTVVPSAAGVASSLERELVGAGASAGRASGAAAGSAYSGALKGAVLGAGLLALSGSVLDEVQEAQKVSGQTEAVIRSTGGAAAVSADQFADLASSISKVSGIDDEVIQAGENMLATFTNIRNEGPDRTFDRATRAAVDMGVAMGTDATSAALQLGKALNDPLQGLTRLQRVGVTFTDQQKEQVKGFVETGQVAKAQGVILAEVEREFGGSAKAQATEVDKARVAWGNLAESVGTAALPALDGLAKGAAAVTDVFSQQPVALQQAELGAIAVAIGYSKLAGSATVATTAVNGLTTAEVAAESAAAPLAVTVGLVVAAVAAFPATLRGLDAVGGWAAQREGADGLASSLEALAAGNETEQVTDDIRQLAEELKVLNTGGIASDPFSTSEANAFVDKADKALADLVSSGHGQEAADMYVALIAAVRQFGLDETDLAFRLNDYEKAQDAANTATEQASAKAADHAQTAAGAADAVQAWHQANKDLARGLAEGVAAEHEFESATFATKDAVEAVADAEATAAGRGDEIAAIRSDAARAAVADAKAVETAERSLADAERGVAQAEQGVADAIRGRQAAQRGVTAAERALNDLRRESVRLYEDLDQAAKDYERSLLDLQATAEGSGRGVERALARLQDAQDALTASQGDDPTTTKNEQRQLELDVADAQAALAQAKRDAADAQTAYNDAQAGGVEGSAAYQAAQIAIVNNVAAQQEAQQRVVDANRAVEDADRRVADAHYGVVRAQQAVADAGRSLAEAQQKASDDQVTAAFKVWAAQETARDQLPKLRSDAEAAFGAMTTAAVDYGLGLKNGVLPWLKNLEDGLAPDSPLRREVDALLAQLSTAPTTILGPTAAQISEHQGRSGTKSAVSITNVIHSTDPGAVAREVNRQAVRTGAGS